MNPTEIFSKITSPADYCQLLGGGFSIIACGILSQFIISKLRAWSFSLHVFLLLQLKASDQMTSITRATIEDAEALSVLVNSAYRGESSRAGWTTEADLLDGTRTDAEALRDLIQTPGTTLLKCTEHDQLIGCIELRNEHGKLYLGMLTVLPSLQGRGLGKELMKAAEDEAIRQHCSTIFMTVISVRKELIDWYIRRGYRLTGERKPFAFNDPRFGQPKMMLEFVVLEKIL